MKVRIKPRDAWVVLSSNPRFDGRSYKADGSVARTSPNLFGEEVRESHSNAVARQRITVNDGNDYYLYKVQIKKLHNNVKKLMPWEYLKASSNSKLGLESKAALQSIADSCEALQHMRTYATRLCLARGKPLWRKILFSFIKKRDKVRSYRGWYKVPGLYLLDKYLRYCIDEVSTAAYTRRVLFGISDIDLTSSSLNYWPKPRRLLGSCRTCTKYGSTNHDLLCVIDT
jgi:hypothetical protein